MLKKYCPKCNYEWLPRASDPKRCPRCGKWLKWTPKNKKPKPLAEVLGGSDNQNLSSL